MSGSQYYNSRGQYNCDLPSCESGLSNVVLAPVACADDSVGRPTIVTYKINSTYGADASVLVQMNTESAQTTCMHCYKF